MADLIKFEIVTPEKTLLKENISSITVPTKAGEITILPNHIPIVASLTPGVIQLKKENGDIEIISVSGGFIEVLKNKIVMLADTAERADEIDLKHAEEAKIRAEEAKHRAETTDDIDFASVSASIAKELARVKAVERWRKLKK